VVVWLAGATAVFVATNLDGFVLLTVLFATPRLEWQVVVAGWYLGLTALIALSAAGAAGLALVPRRWVGLAGIILIVLGARMAVARKHPVAPAAPFTLLGVSGLVVSNGVDNVALYTPTFRHLGVSVSLVYTLIFVALAALWCAMAWWLARWAPIARAVERWSHVIVPAVFVIIGCSLLATTFLG
jgi:cadmium resistance protein CadD (predicted permease)